MAKQTNWAHFIAMQAGVVPVSIDDPGWAKSAVHAAMAELLGCPFYPVMLSQKLREDIGGVPVPSDTIIDGVKHRCVVSLLDEVMLRAKHEFCIVLLDELNQTTHDVLGAAQEWINSPPKNCLMAACMNPVDRSTSGMELSAPVVNRVCMLQWERHDDERRQGWLNGFKDYPAPELPMVPVDYLDDFGPKWGALLCQFEEHAPEHFGLDTFPENPADASKPWRSGRSWSNLGKCLAACESVGGSKSTASKLAQGCVGQAGQTFLTWVDQQDLQDPREVLDDPACLKLPPRFDLARGLVAGVVGIVKQEAEDDPRVFEKGLDVLEEVFRQSHEVALSAHGSFWKTKPGGYEPKHRSGTWDEIIECTTNKRRR